MSKFMEANEKIAEAVVEGYKKIEDGVVGGCSLCAYNITYLYFFCNM